MLILSRKMGESLIIGDNIEIRVTEIAGDKVKLGIEAPQDLKILRKELYQTVEGNRQAASGSVSKEKLLGLIADLKPKE